MPFKTFQVNEILTAADVNDYLAEQAVATFAGTAARGSAISSPVEGQVTYLQDTDAIEVYAGTALGWVHTASAGTPSYRYVDTIYYTSNGTFTKADYPWLRAIRVKVQGGGGAGGGCGSTGADEFSVASGGHAGGYAEKFITDIAGLSSSVTVTRGAGGIGVSADDGNGGGSSSFDTVSATGGDGGVGTANANSNGTVQIITTKTESPGDGSGGDINILGGGGQPGVGITRFFGAHQGGNGGDSVLSGGGRGRGGSTVGPGAFGSGGSGRGNSQNQSAGGGGAGGDGIVIVELYA